MTGGGRLRWCRAMPYESIIVEAPRCRDGGDQPSIAVARSDDLLIKASTASVPLVKAQAQRHLLADAPRSEQYASSTLSSSSRDLAPDLIGVPRCARSADRDLRDSHRRSIGRVSSTRLSRRSSRDPPMLARQRHPGIPQPTAAQRLELAVDRLPRRNPVVTLTSAPARNHVRRTNSGDISWVSRWASSACPMSASRRCSTR